MPERPRKLRKRRPRVPPGTPPGWLPEERGAPPAIEAVLIGPETLAHERPRNAEAVAALRGKAPVLWLDVVGRPGYRTLRELGRLFGIHPLALEDLANRDHRPKIDVYEDHLIAITRYYAAGIPHDVGLALGRDYVLTIRDDELAPYDRVRQRLANAKSLLRRSGADYLAYRLIDASIDSFFAPLEALADDLDALEEAAYDLEDVDYSTSVHAFRGRLLQLRRQLWPQREALCALLRDPPDLLTRETCTYLRDCADHLEQALDELEAMRESASGLMSAHLTAASHRVSESMTLLTVIATIFIPISFVAGLFGMNFDVMPGLHSRWGFPAAVAVMALMVLGMLLFFRSRGLGLPRRRRRRDD